MHFCRQVWPQVRAAATIAKSSCHWIDTCSESCWCGLFAFVLSVIRHLIKSLPAGTACAANPSLPISESSFRFVVLLWDCHLVSSSEISLSFSGGKHICYKTESNSRPRKEKTVAGPSTLSMATGNPRCMHTLRKHCKCSPQLWESGAPTMR